MTVLSLVIPTFNEAKFLSDLLACVDQECDVIVVDDVRSTDGAESVAKKYGARYLTCEGDVSRARNMGAEAAIGEYILFLDADQLLWYPDPIRRLIEWLACNPVNVGTGPIEQTWTTKQVAAELREVYRRYLPTLSGGYTLIRRDVFFGVGGFNSRATSILTWEDVDLDFKLRLGGYRIEKVPFTIVHRREFTWRLPNGIRIL